MPEPTPAALSGRPPSLVLVGEIGCADCGDDSQVTPTAVAFLEGGRIAILDSWEPFVRIFDAAGAPLASFGRLGQGPGEMGATLGMARPIPGTWILPFNGGVAVIDIDARLEAFDRDGEFVAQYPLSVRPVPVDQAFDPVTGTYYRLGFDPAGGGLGPAIDRCNLGQSDAVSCERATDGRFLSEDPDSGAPNALLRGVAAGATPEGRLVVADRTTYRLWVLDDAGQVVVETGRDIERVAKTEEEIERERENRTGMPGAPEIDPLHEHMESGGVGVDGAGRIWVLTLRGEPGSSVFDVFDRDGAYIGEATVDTLIRLGRWSVAPFFLSGDRVAAIVTDADGSERVRIWRIADRGP